MAKNKTIDLDNVLEYYGFIDYDILKEVLTMNPGTNELVYKNETFGTTDVDLNNILKVLEHKGLGV